MNPYATLMRSVLSGEGKSFVVFSSGTVVVQVDAPRDVSLESLARELLEEHGPVHAGSSAGDFSTVVLPDDSGFAVTSHHPDILTLVLPAEVTDASSEVEVGLMGRGKRAADAETLNVVHVEDARG